MPSWVSSSQSRRLRHTRPGSSLPILPLLAQVTCLARAARGDWLSSPAVAPPLNAELKMREAAIVRGLAAARLTTP